ncbi:hypothetical protein PR048_019558 [Dryococelus australis]|uniref:Uncharacterized protein n=1 Tax=Dryococelus australis TaxID=614101 RepID=A0ABQ9H3T3_9NEOP|nr:hypothetical protein PR048_019558 [Dryococelus australis]
MRPLKSKGGITHGLGITESTLAQHPFISRVFENVQCNGGILALQAIVGKTFAVAKISRKARINSLSVMYNTATINDKLVPVSENQLFMRIVYIMKSYTEEAEYFKYELSPQPPAIFVGPNMRKTYKSAYVTLFKNVSPEENMAVGSPTFVIDGCYIRHAATKTWPRLANYGPICGMYVKHITNNCPSAVVVFDGYSGKPGTKTKEQTRRAMRRSCPDLARVRVDQAKDGADVREVTTALDIELSGNPAIPVGADTDLLVMLIYRNRPNENVKILHISTNKTSVKLYDIATIQKDTGDMQSVVLFAHAVTGEVVNIFNSPASHPEEVANTGEMFVRALYPCGDKFDNIDDLRLHLYNHTEVLAASFELAVLPPTKAALYQHSLRTYLQIQEWRGNELPPTDWRWHFSDSQDALMPVLNTLPPEPRAF